MAGKRERTCGAAGRFYIRRLSLVAAVYIGERRKGRHTRSLISFDALPRPAASTKVIFSWPARHEGAFADFNRE
jgi:hypothetical protein